MRVVLLACLVIAMHSLKISTRAISLDVGNATTDRHPVNDSKATEPIDMHKPTTPPEHNGAPLLHEGNDSKAMNHTSHESDEDILTHDLLIDDNTLDNYTIILETLNNTNIVQILGGSDFINSTTPVNEVFTVLLEGDPSNGETWFISNKDAIAKYITPIDIKDDGSTSKFIPDVTAHIGIGNEGTFAFNFKAIQKSTEPIELLFELKHPWDPLAIRTVIVSISIV